MRAAVWSPTNSYTRSMVDRPRRIIDRGVHVPDLIHALSIDGLGLGILQVYWCIIINSCWVLSLVSYAT